MMASRNEDEDTLPVTHAVCPGLPECTAHELSDLPDFDHYVEAHEIPQRRWGEAFAVWAAITTRGPFPFGVRVDPAENADTPRHKG